VETAVIEFILVSLSLVLLSASMLGIASAAQRAVLRVSPNRIVPQVIFFFVYVKIILYYCLPALMRIGSDYQFDREDGVALSGLARLYCIETISWIIWAFALLGTFLLFNRPRRQLTLGEMLRRRRGESKALLVVLTIGFMAVQVGTLARVDLGPEVEVFKSLFFYAGLAAGPFLMVVALRHYGKFLFVLGVAASVLSLLSLTTRGAIVYLGLFSVFLAWFVLRDPKSKAIVAAGLLTLSVGYFSFGGIFQGSIVIDDSGRPLIDLGVNSEKLANRSPLQEIEWRFGASTRMGTAFLKLYDRGQSAGFNPIKHSLQGFLPRFLDPDKPQPSTLDGDDIFSQGMYIIAREIVGFDTYSMVEFPTGAHFYWEFGILGVLGLSAVSGMYIGLCAHFFSKLGIVAVPLMIAVFKPWGYVDPKIWVSDVAMQIYQVILPLLVLVTVIRTLYAVLGIFNADFGGSGGAGGRSRGSLLTAEDSHLESITYLPARLKQKQR
jgi:hypothetical protein